MRSAASSILVGVSGAARNACAAICVDGQIRAACEQERLTRVRRVGSRGLPVEAVDTVLQLAGHTRRDVSAYVVAEADLALPSGCATVTVDHHRAHAATAFFTSPFSRAAVLVCDSDPDRHVSVWTGEAGRLDDWQWPSTGIGFAPLYSECAALVARGRGRGEHQMESLAHLSAGERAQELDDVFGYQDGILSAHPNWRATVQEMLDVERRDGHARAVGTASAIEHRLGWLLLQLAEEVRRATDAPALCLGGGLFYNTFFTTLLSRSGIFEQVFVPINPGNAGLAVGSALLHAHASGNHVVNREVSPFLGPGYDSESIKATLDGCKLSYAFLSETEAVDTAVDALTRGQLVGWFQNRMEWGPRALGNRSILADPRSPYVLDNLNCFLRKREPWRAFGVSVCGEDAANVFCGPRDSAYMQFEYAQRDDRLRHVVPNGATSIRVQTIGPDAGAFRTLHKRMEQATGLGVLVNTSFNGFNEPIVCSPRDAVRVFYGTGLDMLVIGRFVLRK